MHLYFTILGAALKIGQMLSIQDKSLINPQISKIFERVQQSADYMPNWQIVQVLTEEFGSNWSENFSEFDQKPFAAASIGTIHILRKPLVDGRAKKCQKVPVLAYFQH